MLPQDPQFTYERNFGTCEEDFECLRSHEAEKVKKVVVSLGKRDVYSQESSRFQLDDN